MFIIENYWVGYIFKHLKWISTLMKIIFIFILLFSFFILFFNCFNFWTCFKLLILFFRIILLEHIIFVEVSFTRLINLDWALAEKVLFENALAWLNIWLRIAIAKGVDDLSYFKILFFIIIFYLNFIFLKTFFYDDWQILLILLFAF